MRRCMGNEHLNSDRNLLPGMVNYIMVVWIRDLKRLHAKAKALVYIYYRFLFMINTTIRDHSIILNHAGPMNSLTFTVIYVCSIPEGNSRDMNDVTQWNDSIAYSKLYPSVSFKKELHFKNC